MHREPKLAFLVADGGRARLLVRHADGRYDTLASLEAPRRRRGAADTRSRVFASVGPNRSAVGEAETGREAETLARDVAAAVEAGLTDGAFERVAVVAPARMLKRIRDNFGPRAAAAVATVLPKDLTKLPEAELKRTLDPLAMQPLTPD